MPSTVRTLAWGLRRQLDETYLIYRKETPFVYTEYWLNRSVCIVLVEPCSIVGHFQLRKSGRWEFSDIVWHPVSNMVPHTRIQQSVKYAYLTVPCLCKRADHLMAILREWALS